MAHNAYTEFFDRILSKDLIDFNKKLESIKSLTLVLGDYLKSFVIFTMIDPSGDILVPLVCSESSIQLESIKPFLANLSKQENFDLLFISENVVSFPLSTSNEGDIFKYLDSREFTRVICVPIRYNTFTVGSLIFLISDNLTEKVSSLTRFLHGLGVILGDLITRWIEEERFRKEIAQSNFIINLTKLSLSTTEIQRILDDIFQGISALTRVNKKAIFIRDITKLNCIKNESIPQSLISNILNNQYQIENMPFFNILCPISDCINLSPGVEHPFTSDDYVILLPIGLTNVMLGLFLLVGTKKQLNPNNIHLFRVICNLLFVTLQRTKLLDDMQRTIQSAEFSSYPVILVNSNYEILYLNDKAEKLLNTNQRSAVNLDLFYLLKPDMEDMDFLKSKITEVASTISRVSVKLSLDITETGETTKRTFFILLEPTINNLTGEYCIVLSFIDISEAEALQSLAEEYSKRADIYFNILTHDIYNILFAISGYYELIKHKLPSEDLDILKRIDALTKRGTNIVRDIRALSTILKLSRDQQKYAIPLKMTLKKTLEEVKIELEELDIHLIYDIDLSPEIRIEGSSLVYYMFLYIFRVLTQNSSLNVKLDIKGSIKVDPTSKKQKCVLQIFTSNHMYDKIKSILTDNQIPIHGNKKIKDDLAHIIIGEITKQFNYNLNVNKDKESGNVVVTTIMPAI